MVNLHFLSLMEALGECKSTVLSLLLPIWGPVLHAHTSQAQLASHLQVRHQACIAGTVLTSSWMDGQRTTSTTTTTSSSSSSNNDSHHDGWLLRWLLKVQFKMGQIEIQSSTASQFYNV